MTDLQHLSSLVDGPEAAWANAVAAGRPARDCAALKRTLEAAYRTFERQIRES